MTSLIFSQKHFDCLLQKILHMKNTGTKPNNVYLQGLGGTVPTPCLADVGVSSSHLEEDHMLLFTALAIGMSYVEQELLLLNLRELAGALLLNLREPTNFTGVYCVFLHPGRSNSTLPHDQVRGMTLIPFVRNWGSS